MAKIFFSRDDLKLIRRSLGYLKPFKGRIILIFFLTVIGLIVGLVQPLIFGKIVDLLISKMDLPDKVQSLYKLILTVFVLMGVTGTLELFKLYCTTYISNNIVSSLKMDLYENILTMPIYISEKMTKGEYISRFESDSAFLGDILTLKFTELIVDVFKVIIIGIIVFRIDFTLAAFLTIMFPVSYLSFYFFGVKIRQEALAIRQKSDRYLSFLQESLHGIKEIKELFIEKVMIGKMGNVQGEIVAKSIHKVLLIGYSRYANVLITAISTVGVLYLGTGKIMNGVLSLGSFVAFNTYSNDFNNSLFNITRLNASIQETLVSMKRIFDLVDYFESGKCKQKAGRSLDQCSGDIQFDNVTFGYGAEDVLTNLNLRFKRGAWNAIVGENGAGKTTLFKLLLMFYNPKSGQILLDGVNIAELDAQFLRKNIAYVSQEPFFFKTSIKENLRYANQLATDAELIEACKKARIHEYIDSLPGKYDTTIAEMAQNFSSGQKQRLAIARALLKKPEVFLLDEPTSALDGATKGSIVNLLRELTANHTVIVISHDADLIETCDQVFLLNSKQLVAEGDHQTLLNSNALYREFIDSYKIKSDC